MVYGQVGKGDNFSAMQNMKRAGPGALYRRASQGAGVSTFIKNLQSCRMKFKRSASTLLKSDDVRAVYDALPWLEMSLVTKCPGLREGAGRSAGSYVIVCCRSLSKHVGRCALKIVFADCSHKLPCLSC